MTATRAQRRFETKLPTGAGVELSTLHPAYRGGRTIFGSRVFAVDEVARVFKTGHQSRKIGRIVDKGRLRGAPIFTLTLEERATCPRTCTMWSGCYGNNMQAAERIEAGAALEAAIAAELRDLQRRHPRGFLVRLHVLGDFYSTSYVDLWRRSLATLPALHVFGFTAHNPTSPIGAALAELLHADPNRFALRFSGLDAARDGAVIANAGEPTEHIVCPAQRGLTDCCATCALCWQSRTTITFLRH